MAARIRVARFGPTHLPRVLDIEKAVFPREAYDRQMFLDLHRKCGALFFIVRRGRAIAGYMVTCLHRGQAEIVSIAVHPGSRGTGAGTALMRYTLRRLRQLGVRCARLIVRTTNTVAVDFYRRFQFQRIRRVPRYYNDGADGILYRLRLQ
jgi:ribosomal-protein-alanine N-acetyltransferase